jgi:hypothetical protein
MIARKDIEDRIEKGTIYQVANPTLKNVYRVKIDWGGLISEDSYNPLAFNLKSKVIFSFLNENIKYTEEDKLGIGKLYENIVSELYQNDKLMRKYWKAPQGDVKVKVDIVYYDEYGRRTDVVLPRFGEIFELFEEGIHFLNDLLDS